MLDAQSCHQLHILLEVLVVASCCGAGGIACHLAAAVAERVPYTRCSTVRVGRTFNLRGVHDALCTAEHMERVAGMSAARLSALAGWWLSL